MLQGALLPGLPPGRGERSDEFGSRQMCSIPAVLASLPLPLATSLPPPEKERSKVGFKMLCVCVWEVFQAVHRTGFGQGS